MLLEMRKVGWWDSQFAPYSMICWSALWGNWGREISILDKMLLTCPWACPLWPLWQALLLDDPGELRSTWEILASMLVDCAVRDEVANFEYAVSILLCTVFGPCAKYWSGISICSISTLLCADSSTSLQCSKKGSTPAPSPTTFTFRFPTEPPKVRCCLCFLNSSDLDLWFLLMRSGESTIAPKGVGFGTTKNASGLAFGFCRVVVIRAFQSLKKRFKDCFTWSQNIKSLSLVGAQCF